MNQFKWVFYRVSDTFSANSFIALLLALSSVLYWIFVLSPAQLKLDTLNQQTSTTGLPDVEIMKTAPASTFLMSLPSSDAMLTTQLQTIFDHAEKHHLDLGEVAYKRDRKQGEKAEQYHMDFSVEATYPAIKAFVSDVLIALPYVSLDQLILKRENVQSDSVLADVRFTLHLGHQ